MKILQLCCHSNLWSNKHNVTSIDLKLDRNIFDITQDYCYNFDLICSAPPCDQFTKANFHNWLPYPDYFIKVAQHCFNLSLYSGKPWFLENPPGRITQFIPALKYYRLITWHGNFTNKEYVIYSNMLLMFQQTKRYSKPGTINNYSKAKRELWQQDFINSIECQINNH